MGKKSKKNKEVRHSSREEARAGDGQIVRIGEKEKCTDCKNWIPWGFTMRIGTPPFRADCGPGAKCSGPLCPLNLCHKCVDTNPKSQRWILCSNNLSGTGKENYCLSTPAVKFCLDCSDIKGNRRELYFDADDKGISDMQHQANFGMIYCGGFDRGSCMATGSVREPLAECRTCALSGERKMKVCHLCGKIRCIQCIGHASDQGGSVMGANNTGWNMLSGMMPGMEDMLANAFVQDCIRRCGHCQRDVCMECTTQDTLTSNLSKGRLFDCKDTGCRCVNCMTKERIDGKVVEDTSFQCDECRVAKKKCHNPECDKIGNQACTRCGKARYCSRECQVAMWKSHKPDCDKMKEKAKAKKKKLVAEGKEVDDKEITAAAKDEAARLKKSKAKDALGGVWDAHDRHIRGATFD